MTDFAGKQLWKVALPGALLLALAVIHTVQRKEAFTVLLGEDRPQDGWRWIKPEGLLHTPHYYDTPLRNVSHRPNGPPTADVIHICSVLMCGYAKQDFSAIFADITASCHT
jgi:hypothetical protein